MHSVIAQRDNDFSKALNQYEKTEGIRFSYDPNLLEDLNFQPSNKSRSFEEFIDHVEGQSSLKIEAISDKYYTIAVVQSVYSVVFQDATAEGLVPIEIATVLVNGEQIPSVKSDSGMTFEYKPDKENSVTLFVFGYEQQALSFEQLLNSRYHDILLEPRTIELSGLTIEDYLTQGINLNPSDHSISINVSDLPLLPGETDGDILASLAALPGINSPDSRAGNLLIRNSPTDQSLVLFEGIPIYHRGHYFGSISPYNPKLIDEVIVHRNGFHPRLGGRVGGAIEINTSNKPHDEPNYGVGANSFYGMVFGKTPLIEDKLGLSVGLRHSYPGSYQPPKLKSITESIFDGSGVLDSAGNVNGDIQTTFQDFQSKVAWMADGKNQLTFSGIFTRSIAEYELGGLNVTNEDLVENTFRNVGGNINWESEFGNRWKSDFSLSISDYDFDYLTNDARNSQTPNVAGNYSTNDIADIGISQEFRTQIGVANDLQFGAVYSHQNVQYSYKSPVPTNPTDLVLRNADISSHLFSPYLNFDWNVIDKLYFQVGLRGNYYSELNDFKIAPRVLANYNLFDKLTLKASAGKYYQYLSQVKNLEFTGGGFDNELWVLADGEIADVIDGKQLMTGFVLDLDSWVIDLEGYYKRANNVTYYSVPRFSSNAQFFSADHKIKGVDLLVKKQLSHNASFWAGYTLSESKLAIDSATSIYYNDRYSQPNILKLGGALTKNNWKLSIGWKYSSGLNARPINVVAVINNSNNMMRAPPFGKNAPPPRDLNSEIPQRFDAVHSLDISASYRIPKTESREWSATFGASIVNSYNQDNLTDQVIRGLPPVFIDRRAISFAPNLMMIVEW